MKNVVAYIFLLLEAIGIIAASVIYANKADALSAIYIQVPEGMQLTFEKETEVNTRDGVLLIPEGTVITPTDIFSNKDVCFYYEGYERLRTNWDNFKEKDQFESLLVKAEHDLEDRREASKIRYIAIGAAIGIGWLVIGGILSKFLFKHEKGVIVFIIHVAMIAFIAFYIHNLTAYLWH